MWRASRTTDEVKEIRKRAIQAGLQARRLPDPPPRHREGAGHLLRNRAVSASRTASKCSFGYECTNLILEGDVCTGVVRRHATAARRRDSRRSIPSWRPDAAARTGSRTHLRASTTSRISPARSTSACASRCETRSWKRSTTCSTNPSSSAIRSPFKNKVRTFCQNPGGFVSQENYDNDLAVVNGHSYKDLKIGQHQPRDSLLAQLQPPVQSAHRLRTEGRRTDEYARRGSYPRPALRRYPRRKAHLAEGTLRSRTSDPPCPTPSRATSPPPCPTAQ